MKRIVVFILISVLIASLAFAFVGCDNGKGITVYVPDGAPALGISYLMKECQEIDGVKITYVKTDGAAGIKSAVMGGQADVAIMPTNMAATLYNGGIGIRVVGTNSYGVLYMVSNQTDVTLESLKGKVVHTVGQGGTPDAVLKTILDANDIEYVPSSVAVPGKVALRFYGEAKEIVQGGMADGSVQYAIFGEPAISAAVAKNNSYSVVLDLQEEWNKVMDSTEGYPQTSLVVKASLIKSSESLVAKIARLTSDCAEALKTDAATYVKFLKDNGYTAVLPGVARANIRPAFGAQAKADIEAYLTVLLARKPELIGNKLPDEGFYYTLPEPEE